MTSLSPEFDRFLRESYAKLLGQLLAKGFPLGDAEDGLLVAFQRYWEQSANAQPAQPEAWVLTVAARHCLDLARKRKRTSAIDEFDDQDLPKAVMNEFEPDELQDERLRVFFLAAHPAIDPAIQTLLMLQIGCGLSVAQVSTLLLEPAETVSQRIVRAKKKIKEAGIEPVLPTAQEVGERVSTVLTAVYALLLLSQDRPHAEDQMSLASEVLWLARSLAELCPDQPEVLALHSLSCLLESRRKARRTSAGVFIPLADQKETDWDWQLIAEGETSLRKASTFGRLGRFQLEAAIQSVLIAEKATGEGRAPIVLRLYTELHRQFPTAGSHLGLIEALWRNLGPEMALQELMGYRFSREYLPYWALKAHLEKEKGYPEVALDSFQKALSLSRDPAQQDYFRSQIELLEP